jgi:transcriptional regulator with XRE-family HTH domain
MGQMEAQQLRQWIEANGYSVSRLAVELGVSRSTVNRWLAGSTPIPRPIDLALEALAKRSAAGA